MTVENKFKPASLRMIDYNKNSDLQDDFSKAGKKLLTENADFGCSHGKNSMSCIKAALDGYLDAKGPISVLVHMNDLPNNDFDEVTKCLNDPKISFCEHTLFKNNQKANLSIEFNKNSYLKKILPDDSLHLGINFNCLHWMENPVELSQGLFPRSTMTTPEERTVIANNAQEELTIFLQARYQELKSKGRLVLNIFKESNLLEHFDPNWHNYITCKGFQKHQLKNVTIPVYFRPTEEIETVLNNLKDEFTIISSQSQLLTSLKFTYESLKAILFDVLAKGVKDTNLFQTIAEVENFVEEFILSFSEDQLEHYMEIHLLVLEKN